MCGGNSGEIKFPDYLESFHHSLLNTGWISGGTAIDLPDFAIVDLANNAWTAGGNPYDSETAFDPDTQLAATQSELTAHNALLAGLNEETDWKSIVDAAISKVDGAVFDDNDIEAAVDAFELGANNRHLKGVNQLTGSFMEINAVISSAFPIALSIARSEVENEVNRFEQALIVDKMQRRFQFIAQGVNEMSLLLRNRIEAESRLLSMTADINRIHVVAKQEEAVRNLEIDVKDAQWDFEIMSYVCSTMAAIQGTPSFVKPPELGAAQSALGGALSGAAVGTSIAPGVGTAIGAGVGGLFGLLQSL